MLEKIKEIVNRYNNAYKSNYAEKQIEVRELRSVKYGTIETYFTSPTALKVRVWNEILWNSDDVRVLILKEILELYPKLDFFLVEGTAWKFININI